MADTNWLRKGRKGGYICEKEDGIEGWRWPAKGFLSTKSEQRPCLRAADESSKVQKNPFAIPQSSRSKSHAVKIATGLPERSKQTVSFDQSNLKAGWAPFLDEFRYLNSP